MPHSILPSVEEQNSSTNHSFSFSSDPSLGCPLWPASPPASPKTPADTESRRKRKRTAPPSPPSSCGDAGVFAKDATASEARLLDDFPEPQALSPAHSTSQASEGGPYLPTPPESQDGGDDCDLTDLAYPIHPRALSQCRLTPLPHHRGREPDFRTYGPPTPQSASTSSPDRYISVRHNSQDPSRSFRLGKPPHLLSDAEKLLRNESATPDPFVSGSPRRVRRGRSVAPGSFDRSASPSESRSVSNPDVLSIPHPSVPSSRLRQASVGAVWNIGGGVSHPHGPVQGVSDGRGGLIGSGTNAPLYTAKFLEKGGSEEDRETFEDRLAAALDIDRTRRTLDCTRPQARQRRASGTKRKREDFPSRTQWKYGEWTREGDISCKQAREVRLEDH